MSVPLKESSRRIRAEAAAWVTRLHGPDRDAAMESGLRSWLAQDPAHVRAFELATEVWQDTAELPGALPRPQLAIVQDESRRGRQRPWLAAAAVLAVIVLCLFAYRSFSPTLTYSTSVGEQRTVMLPDGSRVELNTHSVIAVKYNERVRRVILRDGEAYFDVAANKDRPFIVVTGGREVIALGTVFLVRRDMDETSVTLLDGRVAVAPGSSDTRPGNLTGADVHVLHVGQRLRVGERSPPVVDTPSLEQVTSWRRGQLVFEDTPLSDATREFNRYSEVRVELGSGDLANIRVGGTFRVGDVSSFARAVADAHELEVIDRGRQVLLIRAGASAR